MRRCVDLEKALHEIECHGMWQMLTVYERIWRKLFKAVKSVYADCLACVRERIDVSVFRLILD